MVGHYLVASTNFSLCRIIFCFSQLFYDGYQQVAVNLAQSLGISNNPPPPSDKLFRLVSIGKQLTDETESKEKSIGIASDTPSSGLDLEYDADIAPSTPEPALYETIYLTAHKQACRAACFSTDGTV